MRRGLISRSKAELPDAVLEARIARLRAAMGAAGLDKLIVYTNNTRPAGVSAACRPSLSPWPQTMRSV